MPMLSAKFLIADQKQYCAIAFQTILWAIYVVVEGFVAEAENEAIVAKILALSSLFEIFRPLGFFSSQ